MRFKHKTWLRQKQQRIKPALSIRNLLIYSYTRTIAQTNRSISPARACFPPVCRTTANASPISPNNLASTTYRHMLLYDDVWLLTLLMGAPCVWCTISAAQYSFNTHLCVPRRAELYSVCKIESGHHCPLSYDDSQLPSPHIRNIGCNAPWCRRRARTQNTYTFHIHPKYAIRWASTDAAIIPNCIIDPVQWWHRETPNNQNYSPNQCPARRDAWLNISGEMHPIYRTCSLPRRSLVLEIWAFAGGMPISCYCGGIRLCVCECVSSRILAGRHIMTSLSGNRLAAIGYQQGRIVSIPLVNDATGFHLRCIVCGFVRFEV